MSQSCLTDPSLPIVADASVVINLNATGCGATVLRVLPNRVVLTDAVVDELRTDGRTGRDDAKLVRSLIDAGLAEVAAVADLKDGHFDALVAGSAAETLDDGEAATIALALESNAVVVSDDRKAVALCARRFPGLAIASTIDLLAHNTVAAALGRTGLSDAVFAALKSARMRVPEHHEQWIMRLIGKARAMDCPSLRGALRAGHNPSPAKTAAGTSRGAPQSE